MILRKMRSNYSNWNYASKVEDDIKQFEDKYLGGCKMTKDEVILHLFGDYSNRPNTSLDLYLLEPSEKNIKHRLNMLWVMPLTLLLAPYSYIRYGGVGWTNKTVCGKFILRCVGEDR